MDEQQLSQANNIKDAQARITPLYDCLMRTGCKISFYHDNSDVDNIKHHHMTHCSEEDYDKIMRIMRKNINEQVHSLACQFDDL